MHIVVANLSAKYLGRGETELPEYDRMVVWKDDGSISIHNDKGFKPLNYMTAPTKRTVFQNDDGLLEWEFQGKNETLNIIFHKIYDEIVLPLGLDDPGLIKDKTENQLQEWLSKNIEVLDEDLEFHDREFQTGDGPVDILAYSKSGNHKVAIEIKRVAPINTVGQILRYVDALKEKYPNELIEGVIAAVEFKDKTLVLAQKKNIRCLTIPKNWNDLNKEEVKNEITLLNFI